MSIIHTRKYSLFSQHLISIGAVLLTSAGCYLASGFTGYKTAALILLVTVSVTAMLFDILPVLTAAVLSALIWNFFFIPPVFTFHINNAEDLLMFLLYFVIALVNAVLTFKIRNEQRKARDKEEKEKTIKLYNTLLNSLSHELRTPVATVIGAVDTLKENRDRLSVQQQHELLTQIETAGLRLNRQVENLLNMSRLETGMLKLNPDWCDMTELVNAVIQDLDNQGGQTIVFEPDDNLPLFRIDRGLTGQILQNLLHNALTYTPPQATIHISVKQDAGSCIIQVTDNGPGIPEAETGHLFDKFYRLPHTLPGGSGLGLSIVKGFAEAHNGSVKAANNAEGGAAFTVILPAATSYLNNLKNE